jgi:hypothetical protein
MRVRDAHQLALGDVHRQISRKGMRKLGVRERKQLDSLIMETPSLYLLKVTYKALKLLLSRKVVRHNYFRNSN